MPILKESNVGSYMAIDEKTIDGVCYTIISNRETSKIALMADTLRTSELRQVLSKFAVKTKMKVLSVTRDMAPNYDWPARTTFPNAYQVADKFHVLREILEQLRSVRIRHRQAVLALERKKNKTVKEKLTLQEKFSNDDTLKQLLHRSRVSFSSAKRSGPTTKRSVRRYSSSNSPRSRKPTNTVRGSVSGTSRSDRATVIGSTR